MLSSPSTTDNTLKTVFLGDTGVGKTCVITRYMHDRYSTTMDSTIGCSFYRKYLEYHGKPYKVDIWDTAGQERFRSLMPMYYRNANIVYICLDLTRDDFRERFYYWKSLLEQHTPSGFFQKIIVVGTKSDMLDSEHLSNIKLLFHSFFVEFPYISYFCVSSKENIGIHDCFEQSFRLYFRDLHLFEISHPDIIGTSTTDLSELSLDGSDIRDATELYHPPRSSPKGSHDTTSNSAGGFLKVYDKGGKRVVPDMDTNKNNSWGSALFYCSIL